MLKELIGKIDFNNFHGTNGMLSYYDPIEKKDIFKITLKKFLFFKWVKIETFGVKDAFIRNIGLKELNRKEKLRFYEDATSFIITSIETQELKLKKYLLNNIGITEDQFAFLVEKCKITNE